MVIIKKHNLWTKVITEYDQIVGWVDGKQLTFMSEKKFQKMKSKGSYAIDICCLAIGDVNLTQILFTSYLPDYDGITLRMPDYKLRYSGQTLTPQYTLLRVELLRKLAFKYIGAPELRGGRSPFGIDSGSLIQNIFKIFGVKLPRFPIQQVAAGEIIDFIDQAVFGDLAFFSDEDGKVNHVGILLEEGKVLHVFGEVREDFIDHFGIYNLKKKRYTHTLRIIKRVIDIQTE